MADKDLTLRLRLNWSEASRESRRFHAEEQARLNQYQDAFDRHFKKGTAGADQQTSAMGRLGSAAERAGEAVKGMALGYAGIGAAVGSIRMISDVIAQVSANALKSGEASFELENRLRALATLTGKTAPGETARDVIGYSMKTGMSIGAADAFQQAFFGSSPAGVEKGNITQATLDRLVVEAGTMSARQGADPKTRGDLAGIMAQFKKYGEGEAGVKEALGDIEKVRYALTAGRGEDKPLTDSLLHVAGSLVKEQDGLVKDLPQLAAMIGTASLSAGAMQSDVRTEQLARGLRGTTPKQMKFLQEWAGIGEHDDLETRVDKGVAALRKTMKEGRDPTTFLVESGMNAEQTRALVETEGVYEVYKSRLADARKAGSGEDVLAANREFVAGPGGRMAAGKAASEGAEAISGEKFQDWTQTLEWAKAAYKARGAHLSIGEGFKGIAAGLMTRLNPFAGTEARQEEIALEALQQQVEEMGLTDVVARRTGGTLANWAEGGAEKGFFGAEPHERGRIMAEEIRKAGGVPGKPLEGEITALLGKQTTIMEEEHRERTNAPGPVLNGRPTTPVNTR